MRMFIVTALLAIVGGILTCPPVTAADKVAVVVAEPRDGAKVAQVQTLRGMITDKVGYPVVFVLPLIGGNGEYYVQPPPTKVGSDGRFSARIHCGDENTQEGTKFRITVLVFKTAEEAGKYKEGDMIGTLPDAQEVPRSEDITVKRE